ncbi:MAG TPA: SRPBCC domain-containing protein, partial [Lacunisphaera sp.]|nr:SRPBCC domain-containing protein [Lacunisphaera sp.]
MSIFPSNPPAPDEIVNMRVFPASAERLFAAFRDPARLAQWWGPKGFTNTFHEFDFRPGGVWRFTMHTPDGAAHAMDQRFSEVVPFERIVLRHLQPGHDFTLAMLFAAWTQPEHLR